MKRQQKDEVSGCTYVIVAIVFWLALFVLYSFFKSR